MGIDVKHFTWSNSYTRNPRQALSDQTEDGMPYLLVNFTEASMNSDADMLLTISK